MGINIGIEIYKEGKHSGFKNWDYWDGCRHTGDKYFSSNHPEAIYNPDAEIEDISYRPKDFIEWRNFINTAPEENIPIGNKERLLDLINKIEENPNFWIYVSY